MDLRTKRVIISPHVELHEIASDFEVNGLSRKFSSKERVTSSSIEVLDTENVEETDNPEHQTPSATQFSGGEEEAESTSPERVLPRRSGRHSTPPAN